ncbi:MAG: nucleotidyltransferase family protein [Proteobacteria bacterium]|nr:nucleotidyltransferase family protein [Pseudomonadota bacterium]
MTMPRRAIVLCAGRGERMRPLSDACPKPLLEVAGATLLDRMLDRLAGCELVVVNAWHLADRIAEHVARRPPPPHLLLSRESVLLDTGGGVANARAHLGDGPFLVCNGDVLITEGKETALERLARAWNDETMDALMLLQPRESAGGFRGRGDFFREPDGRLWRDRQAPSMPLVYASMQIVHPRLLAGAPDGPFGFNLLWDKAAAQGRLHGIVHDGGWFTVDTPENLAAAPAWLAQNGGQDDGG